MSEIRQHTRRRLLKQLATGAVVASSTPAISTLLGATGCSGDPQRQAAPAASAIPVVKQRAVLELAELIRSTPHDTVFDVALTEVNRGTTHRELLAATLLAGIQDVRPWPPGVKFHTVLMAPSALELGEAAGGDNVWLPVFFNIDVLKRSQELDINEGDWQLPPPPAPLTDDPERARKTLIASLEGWDTETADRAVTAAARLLSVDELFEIFWPYGARDFQNIGHTMIHTSQMYRALELLVPDQREPVLRSLVYGLLGGEPGESTASFERNRKRQADLPQGWRDGRSNPEASGDLFLALRKASPEQAVDRVAAMLEQGIAPASIWDGLRVFASEVLFRQARSDARNAQLLGVHPLTILNAFYLAYEKTASDPTRRLMLLQAVAWMAQARDLLVRIRDLRMDLAGFDALQAPAEPISVEQAVAIADEDYVASGSLVLRMARDPVSATRFIETCRTLMLSKSPEHHHHKYAAAAFEEFGRTDPRWAPYLLATCLSYLPTPAVEDTEVTRVVRRGLARMRG